MGHEKRILIVYYSLTRQTERVIRIYQEELIRAGHSVDLRKIEPVETWGIPFPKAIFFHLWLDMMWLGMEKIQPIKPMTFHSEHYDVIILGVQPWNLAPSIPVNSFLESPMARILEGSKVVCVMTCRGSWERAFRIIKEKIEGRGGELIDATVIVHQEKTPLNVITTLYELFEGHPPPRDHWVSRLRPYGIGDEALEVIRTCAQDLAFHLHQGRLPASRGWRIVNKTPSMLAGIGDLKGLAIRSGRWAMTTLWGEPAQPHAGYRQAARL